MSFDWITVNLDEYILFKNGRSSPDRVSEGKIPVYGSNGVIGYSTESNTQENALIIGRVGSYCGSVYHSKIECWVTDNAIIGIPKYHDESEFWYFLLTSLKLNSYRSGSGQPLLNQSTLNSITITIPKKSSIRKKIGKLLFSFNEKICINNQINQTLESISQAIFKSWFIDFEPVKAKIKAKQEGKNPDFAAMCSISGKSESEIQKMKKEDFAELFTMAKLFPDVFIDSDLRQVPKGWKSTDIANVTTLIFSGGTPATKEPSFWNGEIPWLSSGETRNKIIISTEKFITKIGVRDSSTKLAIYGDILIASAGQGHTRGQTSFNAIECYINQSIVALRASDEISPYWLYYCLEPRYDEMRSLSDSHSSRGSLTTKLLASMPVILPKHELIISFDKIIQSMVAQQIKNLREINVLVNLRDSLLPKLLSGELSISMLEDCEHGIS